MADLKMIETGDGGDFVLIGPNLELINGFQNMPYLALFGGNIETNTKEFTPDEQRLDWWANNLLMPQQSLIQFNSDTERLLNSIALTSDGRLQIEQIVKKDLGFMANFSSVTVSASIISTDRVEIIIEIIEPTNLETTQFVYIWDSTQTELTQQN